jgi:hypothetical protein
MVDDPAGSCRACGVGVLVSPVRRRSGLDGPFDARSAYRCVGRGRAGSPSTAAGAVVLRCGGSDGEADGAITWATSV